MKLDAYIQGLKAKIPDEPFWLLGKTFKALLDAFLADHVIAGTGLDEIPGAKGRTLSVNATAAAAAAALPFAVTIIPKPGVPGSWLKGVALQSYLFPDRSAAPIPAAPPPGVTINNLLTSATPLPADAGWKPMLAGATKAAPDFLWLEVPGDPVGGVSGNASVKSLGNSDVWDGGMVEYAGTPPVQTFCRLPLGAGWFATNSPDVNPIWVPFVYDHRVLSIDVRTGQLSAGGTPLLITSYFPDPF